MASYRDYCNEMKAAGQKPLSMKDWAQARKSEPPEPFAEGMADPNPGIENDPEDKAELPADDAAVVERVQAQAEDPLVLAAELRAKAAQLEAQVHGATPEDQKTKREEKAAERGKWVFHSPNSRFLSVTLQSTNPYTVNGHHYAGRHVSADFSFGNWSTEDAELADRLMQTPDYKSGQIYLVDEKIQTAIVGISDGPRTSTTLSPRVRPAGALSAHLD